MKGEKKGRRRENFLNREDGDNFDMMKCNG